MAVLLAALCADGRTEIGNIRQIDRGYERIDERLRDLGARIDAGRDRAAARTRLNSAAPMALNHPTPSGTRDVLPDEMRELRSITERCWAVFERRLRRGLDARDRVRPGVRSRRRPVGRYRLFDDQGSVLALRSDMTVPIARVAATRYADAELPLRFCSFAHVYRGVKPHRGQMREFLQAGVELIGEDGPGGTARC